MGNESSSRIWDVESAHAFTQDSLQGIIREIDMRVNGSNAFTTITRTAGLITKIDYYGEVGRTTLILTRDITYSGGLISTIESIYYNANATEDCRVLETVVRNVGGDITSCDSVFSTSEAISCD